MVKERIQHLMSGLRRCSCTSGARVVTGRRANVKGIWFPRHVSDLDNCNHLCLKMEPELDMTHPGWSDQEYRSARRLVGWLVGRLVGQSVGWSVGRLVSRSVGQSVSRSVGQLEYRC